MGCKISTHQEIDMLNRLVVMKFQKCALGWSSLFLLGQFIVRDAACKTILAAYLIVIVCMKLREIISLFLASM